MGTHTLWDLVKGFYYEIKRTGWALLIALLAAVLISKSGREIFHQQLGVLAWKLLLVGVGIFVSHKARKQLFPYLDLSSHVAKEDWQSAITTGGGLVFLAISVLSAAIIMALCGGL